MKNIILLLVLTISFSAYAQTFGASSITVEGTFNAKVPIYKKWLNLADTTDIVIKFSQTQKGISDAIDVASKLLLENDKDIDSPDIDKTLINDGQRDNTDILFKSVMGGKSKINEAWTLSEGSTLHLFLSKDSFEINIIKAYK